LSLPTDLFLLECREWEHVPVVGPRQGNVRVPPGAMIGRDQLLQSIIEDVGNYRLVALTGIGGVGKTRLAIEVATALGEVFPEGVWMVELGDVSDPGALPDAVATALGITPQSEVSTVDTLVSALAGRPLLLVLDNCEHVLAATVELIEALLASSGELKVLTTSRVSLELPGERELVVMPLDLDGGASSPAVTLFASRARSVRPNFSLDDHPSTTAAVVEICRVLDGIPLGIELAAARMAGMGVVDVRDRLDDRFRLLEGSPGVPARQQSLPDLVRWSTDLLDPAERDVLQRASVFAGGFDLATYVAVFDVADDVKVLRSFDRLVRSSLVVADHADGRVRYRLLETVRQCGCDMLDAEGLLAAARDQHARYFSTRAAMMWDRWNGPGWRSKVDWLTLELANLRSAFSWSRARDIEVAADIAAHAALIGTSANLFEAIGWVEQILEPASMADMPRLPRLYAAAGYACFVGRASMAAERADRAMALEAQPGYDPCQPGLSAFIGALANVYAGNLERYVELASVAAELPGSARAFGRPALVDGLQSSGRVDEALAQLDGAVTSARELGSPFWLAYSLWIAGMTLAKIDPSRALSLWDEGVAVVRENGVDFFRGFLARDAARLHTSQGDVDAAVELFGAALDAFHRAGNVAQLVITLALLPELFERLGRLEPAATLYAAMIQVPQSVTQVPELEALGDRLAADLGAAMAKPVAAGRSMNLDHAVAYARNEMAAVRLERASLSSVGRPAGLSKREVEVLRLVAEGLTTREIAQRLFISAKTADRHIQNLYAKIGASTRAAATRWGYEQGLVGSGRRSVTN